MNEDAEIPAPLPETGPAPAEIPPPARLSWREGLLAPGELDRHAALLSILGEDQPDFLRVMPALPPEERNRLLEALWLLVDVLLIEGRDKARPIFAVACSHTENPVLRDCWLKLVGFFRPADKAAPLDPERVRQALAAAPEAYRRSLARALLIHPNAEVRALARAGVEPADCWYAITGSSTSPRVLFEIWQSLRDAGGRGGDGVLKIFLAAIADRFLGELPREQLVLVAKFLVAIFQVEAFHERAFRQLVLQIDKNLRAQAARHGIDLLQDPEYRHRAETFAAAAVAAEQPIAAWAQVPLPVQRTLARRGLFLRHFCCHPADPVALECFPHLLRRDDIVEFLKILTINSRLLAQLAEEKQLFESDAAKFFLLANPRCPFHIIGKYMGYLTSESLTKLSQGYLYNTFARKQAERLLEQRGKARKPPR